MGVEPLLLRAGGLLRPERQRRRGIVANVGALPTCGAARLSLLSLKKFPVSVRGLQAPRPGKPRARNGLWTQRARLRALGYAKFPEKIPVSREMLERRVRSGLRAPPRTEKARPARAFAFFAQRSEPTAWLARGIRRVRRCAGAAEPRPAVGRRILLSPPRTEKARPARAFAFGA